MFVGVLSFVCLFVVSLLFAIIYYTLTDEFVTGVFRVYSYWTASQRGKGDSGTSRIGALYLRVFWHRKVFGFAHTVHCSRPDYWVKSSQLKEQGLRRCHIALFSCEHSVCRPLELGRSRRIRTFPQGFQTGPPTWPANRHLFDRAVACCVFQKVFLISANSP